ncbi:MAG: hypothetical protein HP492_16470 [Nitrospira sp.]|nr:hypothetical protein [Nitrospira sp.]
MGPTMVGTQPASSPLRLPLSCESALLERFLKAEAMALWAVRASQLQDVPANVHTFLRRHEADERRHLAQFEALLGHRSYERERLPSVPRQWPALAVHLFGYEALGLEFALLLAEVRPDLSSILDDERRHVGFFEREIGKMLSADRAMAVQAKTSARAWWHKLPRTLDRYLSDPVFEPFRPALISGILASIQRQFIQIGLLEME